MPSYSFVSTSTGSPLTTFSDITDNDYKFHTMLFPVMFLRLFVTLELKLI